MAGCNHRVDRGPGLLVQPARDGAAIDYLPHSPTLGDWERIGKNS
jgi:hypothetical protein